MGVETSEIFSSEKGGVKEEVFDKLKNFEDFLGIELSSNIIEMLEVTSFFHLYFYFYSYFSSFFSSFLLQSKLLKL